MDFESLPNPYAPPTTSLYRLEDLQESVRRGSEKWTLVSVFGFGGLILGVAGDFTLGTLIFVFFDPEEISILRTVLLIATGVSGLAGGFLLLRYFDREWNRRVPRAKRLGFVGAYLAVAFCAVFGWVIYECLKPS